MLRFRSPKKKVHQSNEVLKDGEEDDNHDKKYSVFQLISKKWYYSLQHALSTGWSLRWTISRVVILVLSIFGAVLSLKKSFQTSPTPKQFVRIVHLENLNTLHGHLIYKIKTHSKQKTYPKQLLLDSRHVKPMSSGKHMLSSESYDGMYEEFESEDCKAMTSWQKQAYPTCNIIHQVDLSNFFLERWTTSASSITQNKPLEQVRFLANGGFRGVWKIHANVTQTPFVLKTLVQGTAHSYRHYDRHRRDALTTSLLQSSKHIPNIYAYCSNAGLFDYASEGDLEGAVYTERWTSKEKLRYAWQVSVALADVHGLENEGHGRDVVPVSHTDISLGQFLWMDGMYKLNDFNRARFIRWNIKEDTSCPFEIGRSPGKFRSPEEYDGDYLTEKIDVFSLGNILLTILRQKHIFSPDDKTKNVQKRTRKGIFATANISAAEITSYDPMEMTIFDAIQMCLVHDKAERSSAAEVEKFLRDKMDEFHIT